MSDTGISVLRGMGKRGWVCTMETKLGDGWRQVVGRLVTEQLLLRGTCVCTRTDGTPIYTSIQEMHTKTFHIIQSNITSVHYYYS